MSQSPKNENSDAKTTMTRTISKFNTTKTFNINQHCEKKDKFQNTEDLFASYLPNKTEIIDIPDGLQFLNKLRPVKFKWQNREPDGRDGKVRGGFIAQEIQEAQKGSEYLDLILDDNPDKLEVTQGNLLPVMVKAIQELSAENTALKARLDAAGL